MSEKLILDRNASDNEYFHRDFHITADRGVRYLGENYGDDSVVEYLTMFTKNYYSPLIEKIKAEGMTAIKDHIIKTYNAEKSPDAVKITETANNLLVEILYCPAVKYMKQAGYEPSKWFSMTTSVVYKTIADETGYKFEMNMYDEKTGKAEYVFCK